MSLFTNSEAEACKIWQVEDYGSELKVSIQDGNRLYSYLLSGLTSSSPTSAIKSAVVAELIKTERLPQRTDVEENKRDANGNPI